MRAMKAETQKATVVAKPRRFCTRTNAECIVFGGLRNEGGERELDLGIRSQLQFCVAA